MTRRSWLEPPNAYAYWGVFLARNAKDAIWQAAADEAFSEWAQEQRRDGSPPFKGLKASLCLCEHGVCWGCAGDDECSNCAERQEALAREDEEFGVLAQEERRS